MYGGAFTETCLVTNFFLKSFAFRRAAQLLQKFKFFSLFFVEYKPEVQSSPIHCNLNIYYYSPWNRKDDRIEYNFG